jgi:hypothetical protein
MNIETAVADKIIELLKDKEGWEENTSFPYCGHFKKKGCVLSFACGNFWLSEPAKYFIGDSLIPLRFDEKNDRRIQAQFDSLLKHLQGVQKEKVAQESLSAMENAFSVLCNNTTEP